MSFSWVRNGKAPARRRCDGQDNIDHVMEFNYLVGNKMMYFSKELARVGRALS
jgi:hypothetical protein